MKQLIDFAVWFTVGYIVTNKVLPVLEAKLAALDLDDAWDVFNE